MVVLKDFEVTVSSDDKPLPEHPAPDTHTVLGTEGPETLRLIVNRYLEAVPRAKFCISLRLDPSYRFTDEDYLGWKVEVDGQQVSRKIFWKPKRKKTLSESHRVTKACEYQNGKTMGRELFFGEFELEDRNDHPQEGKTKPKVGDIGTISVVVRRMRKVGDKAWRDNVVGIDRNGLTEEDLKGKEVDLAVSFGEPSTVRSPANKYTGKRLDEDPLATFVFHYRSRIALQKLGVIEPTPEPLPLEGRPLKDLTKHEKDQLIDLLRRRLNELSAKVEQEQEFSRRILGGMQQTNIRGIKREADDAQDVKVTPRPKVARRKEVIDLSD